MHPSRTPLARALRRQLRCSDALLPAGATVVVAFSGGRDSCALLHLLRFASVAKVTVHAAHLDHAMRAGSTADAHWCRGVARAWGVTFHSERTAARLVSEADARTARYAFFEAVRTATGADRIVTGHHADDQAETILFRLLRGTGWPGIAGIPRRREAIVRPLLSFRGSRLAAYAHAVGLRWREDATNRSERFARNRLRLDLAALEGGGTAVRRGLVRLGHAVAHSESVLRPVLVAAERLATLERTPVHALARGVLLSYDPWTRARVMRNVLRRHGIASGRATRAAGEFLPNARSGAVLDLPAGLLLERSFDRFLVRRAATGLPDRPLNIGGTDGTGEARIGERIVRVQWGRPIEAGGPGEGHRGAAPATTLTLDAGSLNFPLTLRGWRPGDRITLDYGTKKLKKLFAEHRLARSERSRVPVLSDAAGVVLWVPGIAVATAVRARAASPLHVRLWM